MRNRSPNPENRPRRAYTRRDATPFAVPEEAPGVTDAQPYSRSELLRMDYWFVQRSKRLGTHVAQLSSTGDN